MNAAVRASSLYQCTGWYFKFCSRSFLLFILVYYRFPDLEWPTYTQDPDLFVIAVLLLLLVRSFKFIIITAVVATIGWLWYGTATGKYGFNELYKDGKAMLYGLKSDPQKDGFVFTGSRALGTDREIVSAIDYRNPVVRDFAVGATNENFVKQQEGIKMKYRTLIQCFAVFKKINENWNYVSDPQDEEYIAKASESVKLLAGDCDDHSILMAAAIKAIGGTETGLYKRTYLSRTFNW
jgi:hypothetical protein